MTTREAFTSTVLSRGGLLFGGVITLTLVLTLVLLGQWWLAAPTLVALAFTTLYSSVVRVAVTPERCVVGSGPWRWPRRDIAVREIVSAREAELTTADAVGIGQRFRHSSRYTVGRGPALIIELTSGEEVRISCTTPARVLELWPTTLQRKDSHE